MINATKQCGKYNMGQIDFSPTINKVRKQKYVWQMIVNYWWGHKVSLAKILRVAKAVGIVRNPLHKSITLCKAKHSLQAVDAKYAAMNPNAPMMREEFLRDQARDESLPEKERKQAKMNLHNKC
jgi:hypothetical protein